MRAERLREERGQTTAMVMTMLFVLTLFVAVVVNVGQAVNRKVALQLMADTGAFTGASEMAVGLNNVAYWNRWIQTFWAPVTWATGAFTVSPLPCGVTTAVADAYDVGRFVLGAFVVSVNLGYQYRPAAEATRVSVYNARDLFPGEEDDLRYAEYEVPVPWELLAAAVNPELPIGISRNLSPVRPGYRVGESGLYLLETVPSGTRAHGDLPAIAGARDSAFWFCVPESIFDPPFRTHDFDPWYRRSPDESTSYFVWIVKAPAAPAFMFDELFSLAGGNAIPEMTAAAAAKPVGGSIERGESTYRAKMVPLSQVMPSIGPLTGIWDKTVKRWRAVTH